MSEIDEEEQKLNEEINDNEEEQDFNDYYQESSPSQFTYQNQEKGQIEKFNSINFLTANDIFPNIQTQIGSLSELLNMDFDTILILMPLYKWNKENMQNQYFANPSQAMKLAGITIDNGSDCLKKTSSQKFYSLNSDESNCRYCFGKDLQMTKIECGHQFCNACWKNSLEYQANTYESGAFWNCPEVGCQYILRHSFLKDMMNPADFQKYIIKICKAYANDNKFIKYCPGPGCDFCVEDATMSGPMEVTCKCGFEFCFRCGRETHQPAQCNLLAEWELKNKSDSENIRWIQLNTKICPKCRNPIELNKGCNHMTCKFPGCKHEFCWMCLGIWSEHGEATGGNYKCNIFEAQSKDEKEKTKSKVDKEKSLLEKYIFYFDRYHKSQSSQNFSLKTKEKIKKIIFQLNNKMNYAISELDFLETACDTLTQCRRGLKYTYVSAFYLENCPAKKLFEYNQGQLEANCEKLNHLLEQTDFTIFYQEGSNKDFYAFNGNLINYANVTKQFMKGIIEQANE